MNFGAAMQGEEDIKKGPWFEEEDELLTSFVTLLGDRRWDSIAKASGLKRSGKSCRLRWKNYLRPNLKRCKITAEEESLILQLHGQFGNKWARIAQSLPGRTDNEIKNYWRTHMKKKPSSSSSADEEQGARNRTDNAKPESYTQNNNASVEECNSGNIEVKQIGTSWDSAMGSSDLTSWLYGTQEVSDWRMSELSNEQSLELLGDYNCIESSLSSCPDWVTENSCDTNLWDFSCYRYDML